MTRHWYLATHLALGRVGGSGAAPTSVLCPSLSAAIAAPGIVVGISCLLISCYVVNYVAFFVSVQVDLVFTIICMCDFACMLRSIFYECRLTLNLSSTDRDVCGGVKVVVRWL